MNIDNYNKILNKKDKYVVKYSRWDNYNCSNSMANIFALR